MSFMAKVQPYRRGSVLVITLLCFVWITIVWINLFEDEATSIARKKANLAVHKCINKRVYVYNLPEEYNKKILDNCWNTSAHGRCDALSNGGRGVHIPASQGIVFGGLPDWWNTDYKSLEVIFHQRMMNHVCQVDDPNVADLFYVPFYASLDLEQKLNKKASRRQIDRLPLKLANWLTKRKFFKRYNGTDHFTVLGTPAWNHRDSSEDAWGSQLELIPVFQKIFKLEVERDTYHQGRSVAIPYPIAFHPSEDKSLDHWAKRVRNSRRSLYWSFVDLGHPSFETNLTLTREEVVRQCSDAPSCSFLNCTYGSCGLSDRLELFMRSKFTIIPKLPFCFTSHIIFESLISGSIPVFLWQDSAYNQYLWHFPENPDLYSFYIPYDDVPTWSKIQKQLNKLSVDRVKRIQEYIVSMLPRLLYFHENNRFSARKDALDVSIDALSNEISKAMNKVVR